MVTRNGVLLDSAGEICDLINLDCGQVFSALNTGGFCVHFGDVSSLLSYFENIGAEHHQQKTSLFHWNTEVVAMWLICIRCHVSASP